MNLSLLLFLIGILGFILNRKNIILMIIAIEIMLLAVTLLVLISSFSFDDGIGQTFSIFIITIAGAESVIGLSILVAFYRLTFFLLSNYLSYSNQTYFLPYVKRSNINCTKVFVRSYSTNADLRQLSKKNYSTNHSKIFSIDPLFITGLFDAESSFVIVILKNPRYKTGWNVQARIQIKMHEKDRALIKSIQDFFGGIGYISKPNNNSMVEFRVSTLKDIINVILPHFDNYPLITKKHSDYVLFKQVVLLMLNKEHNTLEGIKKIVNIKASLNLGLSKELKEAFPDTILTKQPEESLEYNTVYNNLSPEWVAGFSTGESNFFITLQKSKTKSGLATSLRFSIAQHSRDLLLLESFVKFFGCGYLAKYNNRSVYEFIVTKIDHIVEHIIPFFEKHPIVGSKHLNFLDFKSAANIIKNKQHLNADRVGLEQILNLKNRITLRYKNKL